MMDAQRLVWPGYGGSRQKVYLIRLDPKGTPGATGLRHWLADGLLPVQAFKRLLVFWQQTGSLSSKVSEPACPRHPRLSEPSEPKQPDYHVDIGLTFEGLKQLKLPASLLDVVRTKAPAFSQGALLRAGQFLGDAGTSDPCTWKPPYLGVGSKAIHALLFVHPVRNAGTDAAFTDFETEVARAMVMPVADQTAVLVRDWIETSVDLGGDGPFQIHFGMRDGISTPTFFGLDLPKHPTDGQLHAQDQPPYALGEFLLGYPREDGSNTWRVPNASLPPSANALPSPRSRQITYGEFFSNATFGAFRKMRQDVDEFDRYLTRTAETWGPLPSWSMPHLDYVKAWLKAKMLGRWPNGDRILPNELAPNPIRLTKEQLARLNPAAKTAPDNRFNFGDDMEGLGCPFGAHIRRMNPRGDPVVPFLRRPLVRRGVPYGTVEGSEEKGLLGLFLCASLEEQFEHLLGNWANHNPMGPPLRSPGKDPLIGNHEATRDDLDIPLPAPLTAGNSPPKPVRFDQAFINTRGTSYALFLSVSSLLGIAHGYPLRRHPCEPIGTGADDTVHPGCDAGQDGGCCDACNHSEKP